MSSGGEWIPSRAEIRAAAGKTIPDVIGPGLRVLFCGINPGLYSGAVGHHFARPGNRFWPALRLSGFTPRLLTPFEDRTLLQYGLGIVNVADRATASADELSPEEMRSGGRRLMEKVLQYRPEILAVLGVGAYRTAFESPKATIGTQPTPIGETSVWVLPNPSGLNAHYDLEGIARLFRQVREALEAR